MIVPQGIGYFATRVPELIEDGANERPGAFPMLVERLLAHFKELDRQVMNWKRRFKRGIEAAT